MPIYRDNDEERRLRIETMLERLRTTTEKTLQKPVVREDARKGNGREQQSERRAGLRRTR
jgi:hypothetical protein